MSFILDALRKSESERRRDAAASLSRAPLAAVRQRTPVWSWFLIGLLSVALLAITTVWWRGNRENLTTGTGSRPPAAAAENPVPDNVLLENAGRDNRSAENLPPPLSTTAPTTTTPGTRAPPASPASLIPPPVRPIRELTALEPNLPRFRLELLAYNGRDPAGGSAWINGQRYFVGERVANGPELVEVLPDGVILAYRGQWFLLTTR
jgi:hypothetical protein